ncbi:MAG: hypothetical protein LBR15_00920 [Methanobrevibacter sp.]|jgi:hypothetical protein|nr:hypothetical protein [Candidatus Methanovirga australis]
MLPETIKKNKILLAVEKHIKGGVYKVGDQTIPDAKLVQSLANNVGLCGRTVNIQQTSSYTSVTVEVEDNKGNSVQASVVHDFRIELEVKVVTLYENTVKSVKQGKKNFFFEDLDDPFDFDIKGNIIPKLTIKGQIKLVKDMARFKSFSVRDAETKAYTRAYKKLLNQDWREKDEIDYEDEEVQKVNKNKPVRKEEVKFEEVKPKKEKNKVTMKQPGSDPEEPLIPSYDMTEPELDGTKKESEEEFEELVRNKLLEGKTPAWIAKTYLDGSREDYERIRGIENKMVEELIKEKQ